MLTILEVIPNEIYYLKGKTSIGLPFIRPVKTLESISIGMLNILEIIRFHKPEVKFYNASSSECFGDTGNTKTNETTPFRLRSPECCS
jgi:GDPmannose 4,6-dehydratase